MTLVQIVIATLALFGHLALWLAVFNRLHALGLPPWQVAVAEKPVLVWLVGVPAALVIGFAQAPDQGRFWPGDQRPADPVMRKWARLFAHHHPALVSVSIYPVMHSPVRLNVNE